MKHAKLFLMYIAVAFAIDMAMVRPVEAQDPASAVTAQAAAAASPQDASVSVQSAAMQAPAAVVVPEPAAPPEWASNLLMNVAKLPVVGPYISKALLYLGILAALLTTLVGASLSILATLRTGFNWAGLDKASAAIEAFKKGKVIYWLTYFSNFNAKKPIA